MANEITITVPSDAALAAILDLPPSAVSFEAIVVEGPPGPEGPPGSEGPPGKDGVSADGATDPGDLTLLFNNKLI